MKVASEAGSFLVRPLKAESVYEKVVGLA